MSKVTRYKMLKRKYSEYCILFIDNKTGNFSSCGIDEKIVALSKYELEFFLGRRKIAYIIVDNLVIVKKVDFVDNHYSDFFFSLALKVVLKETEKTL